MRFLGPKKTACGLALEPQKPPHSFKNMQDINVCVFPRPKRISRARAFRRLPPGHHIAFLTMLRLKQKNGLVAVQGSVPLDAFYERRKMHLELRVEQHMRHKMFLDAFPSGPRKSHFEIWSRSWSLHASLPSEKTRLVESSRSKPSMYIYIYMYITILCGCKCSLGTRNGGHLLQFPALISLPEWIGPNCSSTKMGSSSKSD